MKNEIHIEFSFTQNQDLEHNSFIMCLNLFSVDEDLNSLGSKSFQATGPKLLNDCSPL